MTLSVRMEKSPWSKAVPRKRIVDLAIVGVALFLVAILGALRASQNAAQQSEPSTYDTGVNGYAALYDLLAREGARVERLERPIGEFSGHGVVVIAGDGALAQAAPSRSALAFLDRWVRAGGRLAILDSSLARDARNALGLPYVQRLGEQKSATSGCAFARALRGAPIAGTFDRGFAGSCNALRATLFSTPSHAVGIAYARGRGAILLITTPAIFDNLHISQNVNARVAIALLSGSTVWFDERVHGYAAGRSFWDVLPQGMRIAIAIALAATLLAIAGANLPFAPPYDARSPEERDSSAYIASVARMLERGGASREALARIARRCDTVLANRTGDERAQMLLRELRTLEATPAPGAQDLLHAGRIFARVRKEYGC